MGCAQSDRGHLLPTTQKLSRRRRGQLVFVGGLCSGQPQGSSILEQEAGNVSAHTVNIIAQTKGSLCQFPEPDRGKTWPILMVLEHWVLDLVRPMSTIHIHSPPFVTPREDWIKVLKVRFLSKILFWSTDSCLPVSSHGGLSPSLYRDTLSWSAPPPPRRLHAS